MMSLRDEYVERPVVHRLAQITQQDVFNSTSNGLATTSDATAALIHFIEGVDARTSLDV